MAQPRRTTGGAVAEGLPTRAPMDNKFLMKLAQKNITSPEQLQLGVFLGMKTSSIRDIMRESDDSVTKSFNLLEAWLDSRTSVGNSTALFDELSEACLNLNRADLVNFVRCEQLSQLIERLRKAKETTQSHKKNFNEQMQRVKLEHRETQEQLEATKGEQQKTTADLEKTSTDLHNTKADLQKTTVDFQKTKAELQQTKDEVRRLNELLKRQGSQRNTARALPVNTTTRKAAANTPAPTEEMIASITAVAKPVHGESDKDKGLRTLRVMSMIRQHGMPELWRHVSHHFVGNGVLSLAGMLTSDHLPDFMFLISSCDVSQITSLQLDGNRVFHDVDTARQLAAAVANMSQLRELRFDIYNLTVAIDVTLRDLLSRRPRLKIDLSSWSLLSSSSSSLSSLLLWFRQLLDDFPDRFF